MLEYRKRSPKTPTHRDGNKYEEKDKDREFVVGKKTIIIKITDAEYREMLGYYIIVQIPPSEIGIYIKKMYSYFKTHLGRKIILMFNYKRTVLFIL